MKYNYIDKIVDPADLIGKPISELKQIAKEIRKRIIEVTSKNGGHLASSLGVIELTIALYSEFNLNSDKVVWDVGHQAYAHKLLTGRFKEFSKLRQKDGITGFLKMSENKYDHFGAGHSSTAVSAALGMAAARDIEGKKNKVIAVLGDGALTSGLSLEGLNNAGHLKKDFLVILNDNEMSISENVGALSDYLAKARVEPVYVKIKKEIEDILDRVPKVGKRIEKIIDKGRNAVKHLMIPGMFFEEIGFKYIGPVDGHNIEHLKTTLNHIKTLKRPVLLHVITKKGKGYKPAEKNPDKFHGVGQFDIKTGKSLKFSSDIKTYTEIFSDTLVKLAKKDDKIIGITAAMPDGTGMSTFQKEFPNRYFDTGITEPHAVTFAAGLATQGLKPVVAIYSTFLQRAYDNVFHECALQNLPVIFALDRGGIVGEDGATHNGVFDYSFLRHIPNMVVMAPKDENELQHMLYTATKYKNGPISVRYPRGKGLGVKLDQVLYELEIGKSEVLTEGNDVLIIAIGSMVNEAIEASKRLRKEKINASVINARFVKPLDEKLLKAYAQKCKNILIVEENSVQGGFSSAVIEYFTDIDIVSKLNIKRIGIPDKYLNVGTIDEVKTEIGLTVENFIKETKSLINRSKKVKVLNENKA